MSDDSESMAMRLVSGLVVLLGIWGGPAIAATAGPDAGAATARTSTKAELRRFRALMAEAKKLAKQGKHAAAIAVYDEALAIRPGDLEALTDQGWSAFLLPDLARAERITRQAVGASGPDRINAAAFYNLGRILQAKNDRAGAIAAYQSSLALRHNHVVREQLATLDPAAAAEADPLKPVPMAGPFAKLADVCQTDDQERRKFCPVAKGGPLLTKVPLPYQAATWIEAGPAPSCHVAVQVAKKGWYVQASGQACDEAGLTRTVLAFEVTDLVPGGNPEVVMRAADQEEELYDTGERMRRNDRECTGWLTICGMGQSSVPTCLEMQFAKATPSCRATYDLRWDWELEAVFSNGQVEVKGKGKLDADARAMLGRRPLAFP
jgi:tetratricopeptide (TPR) repeat protein